MESANEGGGAELIPYGGGLVQVRIDGPVARILLNRPEALNALSEPLADATVEAVLALKARADVRVVVLQGAGRSFCSGGDLSMLDAFRSLTEDQGTERMLSFYRRFLRLRELDVPVVVAIQGSAIGAGACLTLICDVRIAREDARIGFNFVKLGLHPGLGATEFLPRVVGEGRAIELLLSGRTLTGTEAAQLGLVHTCTSAEDFEAEVTRVAHSLATTGPLAVRMLKERLRDRTDTARLDAALRFEARAQARCYQTWDFQEGIRAAREKRLPAFLDR